MTNQKNNTTRLLSRSASKAISALVIAPVLLCASSINVFASNTLVVAEHRAARLEALQQVKPQLEKQLGINLRIVEYPAPAKDYFTKLVTELRSGNAPDVFTVPRDVQLDDLAAAGYLTDLTEDTQQWAGYQHIPDSVKQLSKASFDQRNYLVPSIVAVEQLYYRKDLLQQHDISTAQPQSWQELLERAAQIKQKTNQYALLFPAGLTWGMGSYTEGLRYLLAGFKDFSVLSEDGRYLLEQDEWVQSFDFYQQLVKQELMPVQPLLNPEPWIIPKYEMFPKGQLLVTTCGTWCTVFDWGPDSRNPIDNLDTNVATWKVPSADGSEPFVLASLVYAWAVNHKSRQQEAAKKLAFALGEVSVAIAYASRLGNVPARMDATAHADYAKLGAVKQAHSLLPLARGIQTTVGANVLMAGVARATEGLLIGRVNAKQAQQQLHDYVLSVLGEKRVVTQ